jgi:hypothetical protein
LGLEDKEVGMRTITPVRAARLASPSITAPQPLKPLYILMALLLVLGITGVAVDSGLAFLLQ